MSLSRGKEKNREDSLPPLSFVDTPEWIHGKAQSPIKNKYTVFKDMGFLTVSSRGVNTKNSETLSNVKILLCTLFIYKKSF